MDLHSSDGGAALDELPLAGVGPLDDGPSYEDLLSEEIALQSGDVDLADRSAFEDGFDVGQQLLAQQLLDLAPGNLESSVEATRWARWAVHQLERLTKI